MPGRRLRALTPPVPAAPSRSLLGTVCRRSAVVAVAGVTGMAGMLVPHPAHASVTHAAATRSSATSGASSRAGSRRLPVRVMTYNILEATTDGHREGGHVVANWSQRKVKAVRLIRQANPDLIAIQEGASWTGRFKGPRQVDSLRAALGGVYGLAHTEIPPSHRHFFRTGCYVLYKKSAFAAVGRGNHWKIGTSSFQRYAAYQMLRSRYTGARLLFVSPHLIVGAGRHFDQLRQAETQRLMAHAHRYAGRRHLRIVVAGDFNSHKAHGKIVFDGPGRAMRAAHMRDTFGAARTRANRRFNSANDYLRRPPAFGWSIDHIYVSRGIGVRSWRLLLDLRHGHFVGVIPSDHNPLVSDLAIRY